MEGASPPPRVKPPLAEDGSPDTYFPYTDRAEFELADFLFKRNQMSNTGIDDLMNIWAATLPANAEPPFANHGDLHAKIDSTTLGDAPWQSFSVSYDGPKPVDGEMPSWMTAEYEVWFRDPRTVLQNQLANPDFHDEIDYAPFQEFGENGERRWQNFMSGNWAYTQAVNVRIF
jgi:hypothetical protein